jgi:glycosyltransferase involved in cell wall biosynthesis
LNKSLTIVLPVHNGESRLPHQVDTILEIAWELTNRFSILILDDGSTDDTYEVAGQLAAKYPQVSVVRHARRRGFGVAMETVRRRVQSDVVIIHDGITELDPMQVRRVWFQHANRSARAATGAANSAEAESVRDLAGISKMHEAMATAHERVLGFLVLEENDVTETKSDLPASNPMSPSRKRHRSEGVGQIPLLPRPKFLTAVADFALGE